MSGLDCQKPTACCCLSVKLLVCADWAPLMSLWTHSWGRYCCADMLTALAPLDLELEFTSRRELLRDTLTVGQAWFIPSCPPLSFHCSSSLCVLWLSRRHRTRAALLFSSSSFLNVLGLTSYFSCVNGFVLSDTCEGARLWAFVSSAVFPPSHLSIFVSQALQSAVASKEVLPWWFLALTLCILPHNFTSLFLSKNTTSRVLFQFNLLGENPGWST